MNQRKFMFDGESAPSDTARSVRLVTETDRGVRRVTARVSLMTGGAASIRPIPADTVLNLEFRTIEYDALSSSAPTPRGTKANHAAGARIALDAPREIVRIRMATSADPLMRAASVSLHRVDGSAISEEPTTRASPSPVGTFAVPAGFVDSTFVIKTSAAETLTAAAISEVSVRSVPTGPRVRISSPHTTSSPALVWSEAGEFHSSRGAPALNVQIGPALAEVLERILADAPSPLPQDVHVDVHIESDAPCEVEVEHCEIAYAIESRVPAEVEPIVLRFSGGTEMTRTIDLPIPAAATITRAEIHAVESFTGSAASVPQSHNGSSLSPLRQTQAIEIAAGFKCGVFIPATTPMRVPGVAVGTMSLSPDATATASIHGADVDSGVGDVLATAVLRTAGRAWATALFDKPIIVQPPGAWFIVGVRAGVLAWLTDVNTGTHAHLAAERDSLVQGRIIRDLRPAVVLLPSREASASGANGALRVHLADTEIPRSVVGEHGDALYQATAVLAAQLAGATTSARTARIKITSPLRGIITIGRIDLEYDLA